MKNEKEIIQLWKELQITHIDFEFSCGGDSMNDTTLNIHKGDEIIENTIISTYFENEVYNEVRFYEASDGHYMGEMGNVIIHLNDEGEDEGFTYNKQAQSEFNETMTTDLEIELTDEEIAFVKEFVSNINGGSDENTNFNYKKDFIINDKREELIESIGDKVGDVCDNFTPEFEGGGELQDWYSFTTSEHTDSEITIEDNKIIVTISNQYSDYIDSTD